MKKYRFPLIVIILLLIAGSGVYLSGRGLDQRHPDTGFQELMYLPSGKALKVVAFGFDSVLADMIYLKGLIYYSDNARAIAHKDREAKHKFLYKAFDAATDLSPRFAKAYETGGLLTSAVGKTDMAFKILEKGLTNMPEQWWFHVHLGAMAIQQLDDIELARYHYREAARTPGVNPAIIGAWHGLEKELAVGKGGRGSKEMTELEIAQWQAVIQDDSMPSEVRDYARKDLARLRTVRWQNRLNSALDAYRKAHEGKLPPMPPEPVLLREGYLPQAQAGELRAFPYLEDDRPLLLPGGEVRSLVLTRRQLSSMVNRYNRLVKKFEKKAGHLPQKLSELVGAKILPHLPEHPLAKAGYRFVYDATAGEVASEPELK